MTNSTETTKATETTTTITASAPETSSLPKTLRVRTGIKVGPIYMKYEGIKGA